MTLIVLFVDGLPTSFSVHKKSDDYYFLLPKENPYNSIPPKKIEVTRAAGSWTIKGTEDQSLIDQIVEDFSKLF